MPPDRFELPRQLVQMVLDRVISELCMKRGRLFVSPTLTVAHVEVSTKSTALFLHHAISSGNILIYLHFRVNKNGVAVLQWRGILADWGMSKPVHRGDGPRKPRQPERTVSLPHLWTASIVHACL